MTIEERAEEFSIEKAGIPNGLGAKHFEDLYVQIAKEQQRIDIEKACKHLKNLGVFDWLAGDEGLSAEAIKEQFVLTIMEG